MHKDNSEMKTQATTLKSDIQTWRAKFDALERSKNNELQELRMTFENQTKSVFQKEVRELQTRFDSERSQFEVDMRRLREGLENKNRESGELNRQIQELSQKLRQLSVFEQKASDYEGKIVMASQEIERLNRVLRDKNSELSSSQSSLNDIETNYQRINSEVMQLRKKYEIEFTQREEYERKTQEMSRRVNDLENSNRKIGEYENALALLSQERERLEMVAKSKVAESSEKEQRIQQLEYENENFKRKNSSLENRMKDVNEMTEKVFAYESRMSKMANEIERFNRERE
jgi:chromosome segregation ATPase